MTNFSDFGLAAPLLRALDAEGYTTPTPIQAQAIPPALTGRDILGIAQTGTGKTAAFALPILHRLAAGARAPRPNTCRALILSPTRELAGQIQESFRTYGAGMRLSSTVVFGGVPLGKQERVMARGVDVLVATPGRLLDLIGRRAVNLRETEILVLDEADQMLDLGFIEPLRRIAAMLPAQRQTLFFSATMPDAIARLGDAFLSDPVRVAVAPVATTAERVEQRVIHVAGAAKQGTLETVLRDPAITRTLVFARTKHGADRVVKNLGIAGIAADAIHGNKSQSQRERALLAFKRGHCRVLVATDIAARGIDVDGVSHVINFDLPNVPESYVHRIGRTARAGADGIALSFCAPEERSFLRDIERLTRQRVPVLSLPHDAGPLDLASLPVETPAPLPEPGPRGAGAPGGGAPGGNPGRNQRRNQLRRRPNGGQGHGAGGGAT
ncbi:DEAD/DEAH box helicase, partial [Acidisphaera rubrifaciens]|uniref:DEAD/DEAH box helicase n=1 Tax=Acidisphaera rubrifaciens TaxID=50715 RepID=UPI000662B23A